MMAKVYPKKLIEVALPLDDINREAAREKSIRHGHPSTLHLWWARRPLAACRAVIFAQLVNDPSSDPSLSPKQVLRERERLFDIIRELVKWENTTNERVLEAARAEIRKSWKVTCKITGDDPEKLPPLLDPFAGGGSIPLEAQRLGLEAHASDLNPVAVLINKAMIEIPPKFAGRKPVGPIPPSETVIKHEIGNDWSGAKGLAEDVRRYGAWMREEAFKRIGHLYPQIEVTADMAKSNPMLKGYKGKKLTVIAWIWARTVASPNPAYKRVHVPLASTFFLSTKKGKEAWVEPVIDGREYSFRIRTGMPRKAEEVKNGTKLTRGANFRCLLSDTPIAPDYIKGEGMAGRMGARLMAVVAEGDRGRLYLAPTEEQEAIAAKAKPTWRPDQKMPENPRWFSPPDYGMPTYGDLFTPRQLVALTTFSDLVSEARTKVLVDANAAGMKDDGKGLEAGGTGATAYADAVAVYLGMTASKLAAFHNTMSRWRAGENKSAPAFGRQALPMVWDYAEVNPFAGAGGDVDGAVDGTRKVLLMVAGTGGGSAVQRDATVSMGTVRSCAISTDPPYYDNIGYADLSDFFYVWLRRHLREAVPELFRTILTPKESELVATPYRHGGHEQAEAFFLHGMGAALREVERVACAALPIAVYYAFKQSEEAAEEGTFSTGWETFLGGVVSSALCVCGTWPMRTENATRMVGMKTNALASSIVLVCRKRPSDATTISRKQFLSELGDELPKALRDMIGGTEAASPIAPVDLAQAAIGPGMAVFSRYAAVLEADGTPMSVHTALVLINKAIDEYFSHVESDMDSDTRFCVDWFSQYGFKAGAFGEADVLARAKGTSVEGLHKAGVADAKSGKVRLYAPAEYNLAKWDPDSDERMPVWEACHYLVRALEKGEADAGALLTRMREKAEPVRQLAYRLYTVCERKGWAQEAGLYNGLVTSWHAVTDAARQAGTRGQPQQTRMEL